MGSRHTTIPTYHISLKIFNIKEFLGEMGVVLQVSTVYTTYMSPRLRFN